MEELVFLKLGGSLITDKTKTATAREEIIRRAAQEVRRSLLARPDLRLLLGHGSGSFGHVVAKRYRFSGGASKVRGTGACPRRGARTRKGESAAHLTKEELRWGYAQIGAAAARLNRLVTDIFLAEGVPVVTVQPSASVRCRDGEIVELATYPLERALVQGMVPLVYGDVAYDEVKGATIISTEHIFTYLARRFLPQRIVLAGIVAGVYDGDPLREPAARLIAEITPRNFAEIEAALAGSHGTDVTGGMWSKVRMMYQLTQEIPRLRVQIISGEEKGVLEQVLTATRNEAGTIIGGN